MKLRIKSVVALFLFSLFVLFACGGCSSSNTQADLKLISAEGEAEGRSIQSSYTYDNHDRLTSLYAKSFIDVLPPVKGFAPISAETGLEYRMEYDDNGNITQVQLWQEVFEDGEIIISMLIVQCNYTYVDNKLTESVESGPDEVGLVKDNKQSYEYDDAGDLSTIKMYQYDDYTEAFDVEPSQITTMAYNENKNVTRVEKKDAGDPYNDNTYVMTYDADNQMVKYEQYDGVDLGIVGGLVADDTWTLEYENIANTAIVTRTGSLSSTVFGFLGRDIGYLNSNAGINSGRMDKVRRSVVAGAFLVPSKLVQLLSISLADNDYSDPAALLAAQQLIIGVADLYTGEPASETSFLDTILDENGYPQTMTGYDGLAVNFIWE